MLQDGWNSFIKFTRGLDYFAKPFQLTLNRQTHYRTSIGGIVTSLIVMMTVGLSYGYIRSLIYGEDPSFLSYVTKDSNIPMLNINNTNIFIGIRVEDFLGNLIPNDPSKFELQWSYVAFQRPKGSESMQLLYRKDESLNKTCTEANTGGSKDLFVKEQLQNFYCLNLDKNYTIGGSFNDNAVAQIYIRLQRCNKYTEIKYGVKCDLEFFKNPQQYWLSLKTSNYIVNPYNFKQIISRSSAYSYRSIDEKYQKTIQVPLSRINITDDVGVGFPSVTEHRLIYADDFIHDINTPVLDYQKGDDYSNNLFLIAIKLQEKVTFYRRIFTRIWDLLSTIGGFIGLMVFVVERIYRFYQSFEFQNYVYNTLFDFYLRPPPEEEKKFVSKKTIIIKNDEEAKNDQMNSPLKMIHIKEELNKEEKLYVNNNKTAEHKPSDFKNIPIDEVGIEQASSSILVENCEDFNSDKGINHNGNQGNPEGNNNVLDKSPQAPQVRNSNLYSLNENESHESSILENNDAVGHFIRPGRESINPLIVTIRNRRSTNFIKSIEESKKKYELYKKFEVKSSELFIYKLCVCSKKREKNNQEIQQILRLAQLEFYKRTDLKTLIEHMGQMDILKKIVLNKNQSFMLDNIERLMIYNKYDNLENADNEEIEEKIKVTNQEELDKLIEYLKKRKETLNLESTDLLLFENIKKDIQKEVADKISL